MLDPDVDLQKKKLGLNNGYTFFYFWNDDRKLFECFDLSTAKKC